MRQVDLAQAYHRASAPHFGVNPSDGARNECDLAGGRTAQTVDNKNVNNYIITSVNKTISDFSNIIYGLRTHATFDVGEYGSITFRLSVLEDTSITEDNFEYEPYRETITALDLKGEFIGKLPNGTENYLTVDNQGNYGIQKKVVKVVLISR